jgi:hypothetical protein
LLLGFAFVDSSWKKRKREREQSFLLCEFLTLYDTTQKKKCNSTKGFFWGKKWDKVALPKILQYSLNYKLSVLICLCIRSCDWGCIHIMLFYRGGTLIGPSTIFLKHLALPQQI